MTITLSGVETQNKGAELMLYAILQEIERKHPQAVVYLPLDSIRQGLTYIQTSLDIRFKPIYYIREWCKHHHIMGLCRRLHIPLSSILTDKYFVNDTNYLIDGSGFHYSDVWNHSSQMMEIRRILLETHNRHGAKIVLMPQAFGPCKTDAIQNGLSVLSKYADIIFCRDDVSLEYLKASHKLNMSKVKRYCDYTSLVKPIVPSQYKHLYGGVCIIPNCRLFDKSDLTFEEYLRFTDEIIAISRAYKKIPYFLNHEGNADSEIAKRIVEHLDEPIEIVDNLNALEVKGMISTAYVVISSRFHGVASALNTCVPCVATGWSHKYQELFKDYDVENGIIEIKDSTENHHELLQNIFDKEKNRQQREALNIKVKEIQKKVKEMWQIIWNL